MLIIISNPIFALPLLRSFKRAVQRGFQLLSMAPTPWGQSRLIFQTWIPTTTLVTEAKRKGTYPRASLPHVELPFEADNTAPPSHARSHSSTFTGNGHKWMFSPRGSAFLYVRRQLQLPLHPVPAVIDKCVSLTIDYMNTRMDVCMYTYLNSKLISRY